MAEFSEVLLFRLFKKIPCSQISTKNFSLDKIRRKTIPQVETVQNWPQELCSWTAVEDLLEMSSNFGMFGYCPISKTINSVLPDPILGATGEELASLVSSLMVFQNQCIRSV